MAITPNNYSFTGGAFMGGDDTPVARDDIHSLNITKNGESLGNYNPLVGDAIIDIPSDAFVCYYDSTTAAQIHDAKQSGKAPYLYMDGIIVPLWKIETGKFTFRTTSTREVNGDTYLDIVDYAVEGLAWSTETHTVSGNGGSQQAYLKKVSSLAVFDTTGHSGMKTVAYVNDVPADGVYQVSVMLSVTPKTASATKSDLVFQFTGTSGTGMPNTTFHAVVDDSQTFAQQLSFSTTLNLKAGTNSLKLSCDGLSTEYLVFVDDLTVAQIVNGVYHNGDTFEEVNDLTEASDFNADDELLVVSPNSTRKMLWTTLANKVLGFIKNLPTTITSFRSGDVIPVDGPSGTAKMSKDDLLAVTAQNALGSIHSLSDTATEADLVSGNYFAIDGSAGTKKLPAGCVAKRSIQDKVRYEVSKELGVDIADYTLTLHYFIPSYATHPEANNNWCYSSNISLKAGETVYVRGSGAGTNVAMISSVSETTYTNLVRSDGNDIKWYKYTNNSASDMTVALSGRTADGLYAFISASEKTTAEKIEEIYNSVVAIETNLKSANNDITMFKHELGVDIKIPVIIAGSFINNVGGVVTQNGWFTTDTFQLQPKETLNVYVRGYEHYVSVIAQDNGDDTYTSLVRSNDASGQSTLQWYSYTNNGNAAISVVCCGAVLSGIIAYVTKNTDSGIDGVANNLNSLSSAVRNELDLSFVDAVMNAGSFINNVGAVVVQNNWYITSAFVLHSGETLKVNCAGYEHYVSVIAQDNGDDTYTSLVRSNDASGQSTLQWYSYTNNGNAAISVVCCGSVAKGFFAYKMYEAEEKIDTFVDTSISLFSSVAVIGDSYASGVVVYPDGPEYGVSHYAGSWPQILGRMNGLNVTNYTKSGAWTTSFIQDATTRGYAQMLADDAKELYIIALEINDVYFHNDNLGTEADCTNDPENNPTTFYGNYAKIVWSIQNKSPKSRILCSLTERASEDRADKQNYINHNNAIRYVANKYGVPVIDCADAPFATDSIYTNKVGGHPTAIGYAAMAQGYRYLIEKAIRENVNYFRFYVGLDL